VFDEKYQAFLSYSHADDEFLDGAISWLRQELQRASRAVTGREFKIFQDRDGIAFGEDWQERLDKALESTVVMLPILTPSFFASEACCSEVSKFLDYEARKGRNDLILPIYLIDAKIDDDFSAERRDQTARVLMKRQHRDWRRIAFDLKGSEGVKLRVARLAREIAEAIEHRQPSISTAENKTTKLETSARQGITPKD
jgi:F-box protein 11